MTKAALKSTVETFAQKNGVNFVQACQALQAAAAKLNNEILINRLHALKMEAAGLK